MKKSLITLAIPLTVLVLSALSVVLTKSAQAASSCYTFTANHKVGSSLTSAEAAALKADLVNEGLWSTGVVLTSYNDTVAKAITTFQEKYSSAILAPNGMTSGNGYFGDYTRTKMNSIYGCATTASIGTTGSGSASGSGTVATTGSVQCPVGFNCVPISQTTAPVCPTGYTCVPTDNSGLLNQQIGQLNCGSSAYSDYLGTNCASSGVNPSSAPSPLPQTTPTVVVTAPAVVPVSVAPLLNVGKIDNSGGQYVGLNSQQVNNYLKNPDGEWMNFKYERNASFSAVKDQSILDSINKYGTAVNPPTSVNNDQYTKYVQRAKLVASYSDITSGLQAYRKAHDPQARSNNNIDWSNLGFSYTTTAAEKSSGFNAASYNVTVNYGQSAFSRSGLANSPKGKKQVVVTIFQFTDIPDLLFPDVPIARLLRMGYRPATFDEALALQSVAGKDADGVIALGTTVIYGTNPVASNVCPGTLCTSFTGTVGNGDKLAAVKMY